MTLPDQLLTISNFARRVGLTPSALRFYDDCGLLRPAFVDQGSGYRYYSDDQQERGSLLRDLREIDVPLADVRVVLDGSPSDAARVLNAHVRTLEDKVDPARKVAARILAGLPPTQRCCRITLSGPELASAARQVVPAAATSTDQPALTCVLLDLDMDEATLAATDRYRLSVRTVKAYGFSGVRQRVLVPAAELSSLAGWAARGQHVQLDVNVDGATATVGAEQRAVSTLDADYPDYRAILDGVGAPLATTIVDRVGLLDLILTGSHELLCLTIGDGQVLVAAPGNGQAGGEAQNDVSRLDAICTGPSMRVGFTPAVLGAALAASVGPDVLLELVDPIRPVIVRSADQGTFTTLAMPARLDPAPR